MPETSWICINLSCQSRLVAKSCEPHATTDAMKPTRTEGIDLETAGNGHGRDNTAMNPVSNCEQNGP